MTLKWTSVEDQIASLKTELEDAQGKITHLETRHNLLSENLIDVCVKRKQLLEDTNKATD